MLVSRNALRQSKQAYCSVMTTTISGKVDTINEHIDQIMEDAPKKLQLKVSVKLNDDDWQKIQELFDQERKWIIGKMQEHIHEVNTMFVEERMKAMNRYKEYDGCYLGHYAQWFVWFFFTIGISVVSGGHSYADSTILWNVIKLKPLSQIATVVLFFVK